MIINYQGQQPHQATPGDAGYDLRACTPKSLAPGETAMVHTGLHCAIPAGHAGLVCSRSGLALKCSVFVLNAPGVVDHGYTGEVGVILHNAGSKYFDIAIGDRIAQLLIVPVAHPQWVNAPLDATVRGDGGFGSSGK